MKSSPMMVCMTLIGLLCLPLMLLAAFVGAASYLVSLCFTFGFRAMRTVMQ